MTTRPARRPRKNSYDEEYEEEAPPSSKRAPSNRRAPAQEPMDTLTSEEQYLMRVFRQFRKQSLASPQNSTAPNSPERSVSPSRSSSVLEKRPSPAAAASGKMKVARETDRGLDGVADAKTRDPSPPPPTASQPTDTKARLKMMLEKKRMAQAGPRAGSAAATSGAGVQRKAKINKVLGGSSSAGPKLDPMKYPAIGLLLNREFCTFIENKETRELKPAEPLVRELTNFGLKEDDGIKKQYHETLVMRVTVPSHSQSWGINICPQDHHDFQEVLFHFNPRRRFVAMNNRADNVWGQQEKYMMQRWPDLFGVSIIIGVQLDKTGFHVAIDGKYCATFAHRTALPANGEQLCLQVMTKDDYDTNLALVVDEIWWGHKDTMPGLPGSNKERKSTDHRREQSEGEMVDLHIGNLPPMRTADDESRVKEHLENYFSFYGLQQVKVFHRGEKDFGFVKFRDNRGASQALKEVDGKAIDGWKMKLSWPKGR